VRRGGGAQTMAAMIERARIELADNRQLIIFPEGTRRPAGAEPRYKIGVVHLYMAEGGPCVPIALNSGLFGPRRALLPSPGTVIAEILDAMPRGIQKEECFERLRDDMESATARLIAEGRTKIK